MLHCFNELMKYRGILLCDSFEKLHISTVHLAQHSVLLLWEWLIG